MSDAIKNWKYERNNVRSVMDGHDPLQPISIFNRHTDERIETFRVYRDMGRALNARLDLLDQEIKPPPTNPSNEWQDISSAPKDGSQIIIAGNRFVTIAYTTKAVDYWMDQQGEWLEFLKPTHWMPLPEPPSAAKESEVCGTCGGSGESQYPDPHSLTFYDCVNCNKTGRQPKDPAAQTPEAEFAENMGAIADSLASANVPDRTEGEGPKPCYKFDEKQGIIYGRTVAEDFEDIGLRGTRWAMSPEKVLGFAEAAYAEGQASTHPQTDRLLRIEEAAKARVKAHDDRAFGSHTPAENIAHRNLTAALTSDNGETE